MTARHDLVAATSTPLPAGGQDHSEIEPANLSRRRKFAPIAKWLLAILSLSFMLCVAYVDHVTPKSISLSYYYAVGALALTWGIGRSAGLMMVALTMAVWTCNEVVDNPDELWYSPWVNALSRTVAMVGAVLVLSALKVLSTRLTSMVDERTRALRQLATRLAEAEDSERRRLAHDLHDGLIQMLSVLKLNLAGAGAEAGDKLSLRQRIEDATHVVDDLIHKSRTLTFDLHPAMLDHFGLVATLRAFAEEFAHQTGLDVTVNEEGRPQPLHGVVARHLFRSIKELMSNAAKHAKARQVVVSVYWKPDAVRMIVDDDGTGFDASRGLVSDVRKGLGLPSIHERLLSLGGTMAIESDIGAGARVVLEMPLQQVQENDVLPLV